MDGKSRRRDVITGWIAEALEMTAATPADRLTKLLNLIQRPGPVTRWSINDRGVFAYALQAVPVWAPAPGWASLSMSFRRRRLPAPPELEQLRQQLHDGLTEFLAGRPWRLPAASGGLVMGAPRGVLLTGDEPTLILYAIAHQFVEHRTHVRACKRCQRAFYGRKRAEYCSTACGQAFRDAKRTKKAKKKTAPRRPTKEPR